MADTYRLNIAPETRRAANLEYHRETRCDSSQPIHVAVPASKQMIGVSEVATEPTPLRRISPPASPFPMAALGDILGGAARAIVDRVQCADALAASSVLSAASLATQAHADVVLPATGAARPLSLFLVTVAATGDRKSTADGEASRPMRKREERLRETYREALKDYRHAKRAYDAAIAKAEKGAIDRYEIEDALKAVGDEPQPPLQPILTTDEPTIEGLAKLFEKGQPSLGLFSDEGGTFLGGHALASENRLRTMAALSSLWDGAPMRRIRAGDGATILPGIRLALHLMLQPQASAGLLADPMAADQGLLSRILVCGPASRAGARFQKTLAETTEPAFRHYEARILDLLERPLPLIEGTRNSLQPRRLAFDAKAAAAWGRLADEIERKLAPGGEYEPIRGFANKLAEHVARIAGVLTLVDNAEASAIDTPTLGRAAQIGDFYASEALRLFEAGAVSPEIQQAEKLLEWLQSAWTEPTVALVPIYQRGPNFIREKATAKRAVTILEQHGWLVPVEGSGLIVGGKPVREAWRIRGREG